MDALIFCADCFFPRWDAARLALKRATTKVRKTFCDNVRTENRRNMIKLIRKEKNVVCHLSGLDLNKVPASARKRAKRAKR